MSITVLNLTEASSLLRTIHKRDIKDVRAIDLDLALVMENGHKIIISRGAVAAANTPQLVLEFADGDVAIGDVFEKLNHIEVPPETAGTFTVSETKRYGIKRVSKPKSAKNDQDQESDKDNHDEGAARPDHSEPGPAEALGSDGGATAARTVQTVNASGAGSSSALAAQDIPEAAANSGGSSNAGGISWPAIAGGLGLLAAAGGGGGGGGGGAAAAQSAPASAAAISGAAVLGPLNNATITAYDAEGRVIGKATPVVNGRYSMVLERPGYKGLILLAVRDNTPGVADNYADEATLRVTDLGNTVLRAAALADGSNQIINVTALTELAALMAGVTTGQTSLAAAKVGAAMVSGANTAISNLFKVNIIAGDVVAVTTIDAQGAAVINPEFARSTSVTARNYGIALKSISNLTPTDPVRYGNHDSAIKKLADSLQFSDASLNRIKWSDDRTQSDLFGEGLKARANDSTLSAGERERARTLYDDLQKLPNGGSINDYLLNNHVGIPDPAILIKNTTPGAPTWQPPAKSSTVILNREDFGNDGLAVQAPPQSKVEVTFTGHDAQGQEVRVKLPASVADGSGIAVLRPDGAALELLKQMTREQPVTAQVAVMDGDNNRSNTTVWQTSTDVRIDLNTPPGLTDFASNRIMLVNDTFYTGGEGSDPLRTSPLGNTDLLTSDAAVQVVLNREIRSAERLQFAVATSTGTDGKPIYGGWITPADLTMQRNESNGQVSYLARNLVNTDGPVWLKARVQLTGAPPANGYGDARELDTPLQFRLDKTAPAALQLGMAESRDDGISNSDGISTQSQVTLNPLTAFEAGAEVHLRLRAGSGSSNGTLKLFRAGGAEVAMEPGTWYQWQRGDTLQLIGASSTNNGKARLEVRQIDLAGNYTDGIQTFIADSTRVIEQTVMLAKREKAVIEAKAAAVAAQQAFDLAAAGDTAAKQAALASARTALQAAQGQRDQALEQARIALTKSDGSTRLSDLIGQSVDAAYLPAVLHAVAATGDPDKVSDAPSLTALVNSAIQAADLALAKARVYGDNDSNPPMTAADFGHMGISGSDDPATLTLANAALKLLPGARSNTIPAVRAIVQAAARVAALADGAPGNTADAALPEAATYATLGVVTALSAAAARVLSQVIDGKPAHEVATLALIETIANAAQRVTQHAAGIDLGVALRPDDFSALGVQGITASSVDRFAAALRAVPATLVASSKVVGVVDTLDEIRAIVALELGTLQVVMNYAQGITPIDATDPTVLTPALAHYAHPDLAAAGAEVTAERLAAINDAVRSVGVAAVESWGKLALLVKSYTVILNAADGAANGTAATLPTAADFTQVGVTSLQNRFPSAADAAARSNAVKLLAQAVDRSTSSEVDTVTELNSLADIASRIIRIAAGQADTVSAEEWARLHVGRNLSTEQLRIVLPSIAATADDGSEVATISALATRAANALASAERIGKYADNDATATDPSLADYQNLGVSAVDDAAMAASINSVLQTVAISSANVLLPAQVQAIATAYRKIFGQLGNSGAGGAANPAPAMDDFTAIGATPPQSAASLSLLNSVLAAGGKQRTDIDTVGELQDLIGASDTVMHIAAGNLSDLPAQAAARAPALQTTLAKLGVTGLQADSMPAVLSVLQASPDNGSAVDTLTELQTLATGARIAQAHLHAYADDATQPAPTLADYTGMGVSGADAVGQNALNSVLAGARIGKEQIATPALLQAIIDSFTRILSEANEVPATGGAPAANLDLAADATPSSDPLLSDYSNLGLTIWGLTDPAGPSDKITEHLSLLNDVLHRKSRDQVDSLGKLEALGAAVALFIDGRGVNTLDAAGRQTWAEAAALLGVRDLVTSGDGENLEALVQTLRSKSASQIDTVDELQALLEGGNQALNVIIAYATNSITNTAPGLADYTATGITAGSGSVSIDANNLASINAAVAKLNGADVNSRSKLRNVVQAYNTILAAADGTSGDSSAAALQASHYSTIGVDLTNLYRSPGSREIDADKLALFNSVVGAQNKLGVSTPERLESLAATAGDLIRLARESTADPLSAQQASTLSLERLQALGLTAINTETSYRAFLNAVQFKGNAVDPVTRAPRSEDNAATHDAAGVNSVEKLAAIATSYATVLAWVNSGGTVAPVLADFQNIGIQLPTGNIEAALLLLNSSIHGQPDASRINTIAGLNRMVLLVEQVISAGSSSATPVSPIVALDAPTAAPITAPPVVKRSLRSLALKAPSSSGLTVDDLQYLGLTGVTTDNLSFVIQKLQKTPGTSLTSLSALQSLVTGASNAREHIVRLAQDNTGALTTAADLEAIGLALPVNGAGSNAEYLKLFNEALQSTAIDTSRANTPALLQTIITSAKRVVDSTAGHAPQSATRPTLEDLVNLGLAPADVTRATAADLSLLIDGLTARSFTDLGRDHTDTALALPAKLSHLLDVIIGLRSSAATGVASASISAAQLQELGVTVTPYADAAGNAGHHLPAILAAIAASRSDGSEVGSLSGLQGLVTRAGAAQEKILRYADETRFPDALAPTAEDYRAIGLVRPEADASGLRTALLSADRVEAVNAALHASGIGPGMADTPSGIKTVVQAYNAILDSANGRASDTTVALTAEQYRHIGVTITGVTAPSGGDKDVAILSLLNSLVDSLSAAAVSTPGQIAALGAAAGRLVGLSGQSRAQPVVNAPASADFAHFGISGLGNDERSALVAVLQSKPVADFDTLAELQPLAASVRAAYAKVIAYAETNGGAAPTLADYQALAITGVSDSNGHRTAVNAALATAAVTGNAVAKLNDLQAMADSYRQLLLQADGTADNTATAVLAKQEDFERIGVDLSLLKALDSAAPEATRNAVQLLSSLVDSRSAAAIDTPQALQQLVSVVHKLALAEQGVNTSPLQPADFALIGMPVSDAAMVDQIRAQLALRPDNGSSLNTWSQLRTLLLSVTGVPTWDRVAGDDVINKAERAAGVTLTGSAGENDVLTLFYPDGTVMKNGITPRETGGKWVWSYTLSTENWTRLGADGANGVEVALQLQARNSSTGVDSLKVGHRVTIDTVAPPANLVVKLEDDTGTSSTDGFTTNGKVIVTGLAADTQWEYTLDGGATWSTTGIIGNTVSFADNGRTRNLQVRQIDSAGNASDPSTGLNFTVDNTAPVKLVPTLLKPASAGSTTDGTVLIGTPEAGIGWEYSLDRGVNWQTGSGDRIKIKGVDEGGVDGPKSIQLRQTDAAGNVSVSNVLEFNLLTKLDAPTFEVLGTIGRLPDGAVLLDAASTTLPISQKMVLEVSGRAGMTAIVTRDDGSEVGRAVLDASGKGQLEVGRTLTVSGLKTVAGADGAANAVYQLVHSSETIFKMRGATPFFGAAFSESSSPVVDMSKPVYRTGPADSDWYVWSAMGGGYVISRRSDSSEWYREAPSTQPALTPEGVKSWVAVDRSASLVAEEQLRNSGVSSHQRTLGGVSLVNANGWRETPWTYKAVQQSSPENRSEASQVKVSMFTTTPSALDLDAGTTGVQSDVRLSATRTELLNGLSLLGAVAAPAGGAMRTIELVYNNKSLFRDRPISENDLLVLDGTEVRMNASHARVDNLTVGGVSGVTYEATKTSNNITTLTLSKTSGAALTGAEVQKILAAIKLRNSLDLATTFEPRTLEVGLIDQGGRRSYDTARVTIQSEGYGLQVDLNASQAGVQRTSTRYLNSQFVSTNGLTEGTPFVRDMVAPTGTPLTIKLNFTGVHPINEMIYSTDARVEIRAGGVPAYFGSIAGVYGLFWWSPKEGEIQIGKSSGANFTGDEVKRILEGSRMVTTTRNDVQRSVDITLLGPGDAVGSTSRATLIVDTRAPDLDLDASQAGRQDTVNTIVPRNQANDGVNLFKGEVTAPVAGDTAKVVLTLPVPAGTSPAGSEKIVLNADKRLPTTIDFNITSSIGGVDGLAIRYTAATRELSISRQDGASLPGSQVKAILEGLKYSFPPNPDLSSGLNNEHRFEIALVDQAGNTSKGRVEMSTLRTIPASLTVSVVEGQFGYGLVKMSNVFGSSVAPLSFPAVLTRSEEAIPTLPAGFTAASLLQAIRGISAEWGGKGVSGAGNTSIGSLKSYQMFDKLGTGTTSFSLLQQGSSLDTLGAWLRLGLKPAGAAGLNNVTLEMLGGFKRNSVDQYKVSPDLETGLSDVGLANIGLLYQLSVVNTSSRPVLRVRFDSSHNVVGNMIELYEGGRLVGSKTLTASDLGGGPKEVDVTVFQSLSAGKHDLEIRYTDTGGNAVSSNLSLDVTAGGAPVTLTDLAVRGNKQSAAEAQSLGQSGTSYAVISDADTSFASGHGNLGPVFVGKVGGGDAADRYLVTIQMGGKVVAFEDVGAGSFSIGIPAGILPPGYYQDLSISATVLTAGARLGQTTSMQGLKLGWYWAAQAGTAIVGGNGNDELVLGAAADPEAPGGILVQTGAGDDRITVGSFGKTSALRATVTDFTIGMDRVKVFDQIVNQDFVKNFVTASDLNGSTQLQIDLDGAGAGRLYYHLTLQGVQYNPSTIGSIFGV
ncbi:hypothetical protein [Herbaspirillum camelliae]|uniref:hypothetical protein n=1 Tax=Herbaspirillum camelliae TaxID=1892903 RepID=UPI000949E9AE|nr:hypothetical protein [Herbaspirillum camelliae]